MTPEQIAARLTQAQKRALKWARADWDRPVTKTHASHCRGLFLDRLLDRAKDLEDGHYVTVYRLTPLGLAVRTIVEQEQQP